MIWFVLGCVVITGYILYHLWLVNPWLKLHARGLEIRFGNTAVEPLITATIFSPRLAKLIWIFRPVAHVIADRGLVLRSMTFLGRSFTGVRITSISGNILQFRRIRVEGQKVVIVELEGCEVGRSKYSYFGWTDVGEDLDMLMKKTDESGT